MTVRFLLSRWLPALPLLVFAGALPARAEEFSVLVSPPRFEEAAQQGTTVRQVLEITNVSESPVRLGIRTADWLLEPDGGVEFFYPLQPGSCRPWVGLEAAEIQLPANGKRRFRFEVAVPNDAPVGECRFALMLEGDPQVVRGTAVPIAGRIGVIVYVAVGDAQPRLSVLSYHADTIDGRMLPVLRVRNDGNAHGRLDGMVNGVDAQGRRFAFVPNGLPLMPGDIRTVVLTPQGDAPDAPPPTLAFPVRIQGQLEYAGGRLGIDGTFGQ
ncbi:MAG TPA: hypothetical protein VEY50_00525 [Lysobacter sp.]|nr:hypothetical protein [Lysobacter sp.]